MFYQREDLKYPGKLLAILPTTPKQRNNINANFMKIEKSSDMIYNIIKMKMAQ